MRFHEGAVGFSSAPKKVFMGLPSFARSPKPVVSMFSDSRRRSEDGTKSQYSQEVDKDKIKMNLQQINREQDISLMNSNTHNGRYEHIVLPHKVGVTER